MNVELLNYMGSDLTVVNAARVSFAKESDWHCDCNSELGACQEHFESGDIRLNYADTKLIHYLAKHKHWTPFGHCYASFRIEAPVFVARQLGKHQVGLVWNEVSRRYVDSEPEFYTPEVWRKRAANVKQGSSKKAVKNLQGTARDPQSGYMETYETPIDLDVTMLIKECADLYSNMIASGVCPEQARMVLPQSMMTEWWWSGSLAAFARVCKLRLDPHTQRETQHVASEISQQLKKAFPVSWEALMEN